MMPVAYTIRRQRSLRLARFVSFYPYGEIKAPPSSSWWLFGLRTTHFVMCVVRRSGSFATLRAPGSKGFGFSIAALHALHQNHSLSLSRNFRKALKLSATRCIISGDIPTNGVSQTVIGSVRVSKPYPVPPPSEPINTSAGAKSATR